MGGDEPKKFALNFDSKTVMGLSVLISIGLAVGSWAMTTPFTLGGMFGSVPPQVSEVALPVNWGTIGIQLKATGAIDAEQWEKLYGGTQPETAAMLFTPDQKLVMNEENASMMLNALWAFGLANKNEILTNGPMMDPRYGGAGNFASTGGWTMAHGSAMDHYAMHQLVSLTPEQQERVKNTSQHIYRPCCNNPTYFPDCNHGMAMLGLLELMAANGASEKQMYEIAYKVNSLWFPGQYASIAQYASSLDSKPTAQQLVDKEFSSATGVKNVQAKVPQQKNSGGSCGVQ